MTPPRNDVKSPPRNDVKSPPRNDVKSPPRNDVKYPPRNDVKSPPCNDVKSPPRNDVKSPLSTDSKATAAAAKCDEVSLVRNTWRESPVGQECPARVQNLTLVNVSDKPLDSLTSIEVVPDNGQVDETNGTTKSEESNGVGDKIKKFEKVAEEGRLSRPGSVRRRLGSDNKEDLPPPATPFKDNVQFELGDRPVDRPPTVLERQQSLTRNAAAAPVPVKAIRSAEGEKIRPEPQKIIKPEFKTMPLPADVTIRSPSLGFKIADQFPSHGTAFRNVASPDPARSRDIHKFNDDVNTQNNFKKLKSKEKYSVSKGSSYFTRGSEEIWLVKKKDIEEIEERVLDSFRRAGGTLGSRGEAGRAGARRGAYARSESLGAAGARPALQRQASAACTCAHDKKPRASSAGADQPRARSRSHGDDNAQAHVLDKYETLV